MEYGKVKVVGNIKKQEANFVKKLHFLSIKSKFLSQSFFLKLKIDMMYLISCLRNKIIILNINENFIIVCFTGVIINFF